MRCTRSTGVGCLLLLAIAAGARGAEELIDFSDLPVGKRVYELVGDRGTGPIKVWGFNERFGPDVNAAIIFDTANPTGEDLDLGAPNETADNPGPGRGVGGQKGSRYHNAVPLGKLLILAEDLVDADEDELIDDPDDEGRFRQLSFTFDFSEIGPVTVRHLTLIDVESPEATPSLTLRDAADAVIFTIPLDITGDNGVVFVELGDEGAGISNVSEMIVELHGSGAISSLAFQTPGPAIDIEKYTNGNQADLPSDPDVPFIGVGETVTWTYEVENIGSEQLQNVTVTDDRGVPVSCPEQTLDPGDSMACTASGVALDLRSDALDFEPIRGICRSSQGARLYGNVGTAEGVGTVSELTASDSDPSHYCNAGPRIYLRKQKKGPDTRGIPIGTQVTFEILVKNTGGVTLTDVKVADILSPECNREFPSLAPGEARKYECTAPSPAAAGYDMSNCPFVNRVVASGQGDGQTVTDSDTSSVEWIGLEIEKSFKSADASGAVFEITVTNNGCDLDSVEVTDELAPDCRRPLGAMAAGDTKTYTCSLPLENEACAEGTRGGGTVSACDTAIFTLGNGGKDDDGGVPPGGEDGNGKDDHDGEDDKPVVGDKKKASNPLLLLALVLLVGGGLFAWNRMKAG